MEKLKHITRAPLVVKFNVDKFVKDALLFFPTTKVSCTNEWNTNKGEFVL